MTTATPGRHRMVRGALLLAGQLAWSAAFAQNEDGGRLDVMSGSLQPSFVAMPAGGVAETGAVDRGARRLLLAEAALVRAAPGANDIPPEQEPQARRRRQARSEGALDPERRRAQEERQAALDRLRRAEQELRRLDAQARRGAGPAPEDEDLVVRGDRTLEAFVAAAAVAAAGQPSPPASALCPILSAPNAGALIPSYPRRGRIDYGSAVITVLFTVDEAGDTPDEEVAVVPERSRADQPRHFDRFAQAAIRQVRNWSVEFPNPEELSCVMAQQVSITVRFDY